AQRAPGAGIVLTGRSPADARVQAALADLERLGARALYHAADIADAAAVSKLMAVVEAAFGPLHGVIHAAGVLRGGLIARKSAADLQAVLAPKVAGAIHLDAATRMQPLDLFVLFGSVASARGNAGQADYAAANGYLADFAAARMRLVADGTRSGRTLCL